MCQFVSSTYLMIRSFFDNRAVYPVNYLPRFFVWVKGLSNLCVLLFLYFQCIFQCSGLEWFDSTFNFCASMLHSIFM